MENSIRRDHSVKQNVFICGDTGQINLLDEVEDTLRANGVQVVRGPVNQRGVLKRYTDDECDQYLKNADVAVFTIRHDCSRQLMDRAPRLRGICYPTTGVESLDLDAANDRGILVGHGPTPGNVIGLAEATILLSLALLYRLHECERLLQESRPKPSYPIARSLHGKKVGFVGFGRIARAMAERLAPFGVSMLTYSPRAKAETLPAGVTKCDLLTLMRESDIVFVLVSITPESRGMIGMKELAQMKPSAFLVNTARGEAIDEIALYNVLAERKIAGAALDTFAIEPLSPTSPLRALDNVILTPHMVGQTQEAFDEFAPTLTENIMRLLRGSPPKYCKNPEVTDRWLERFAKPLVRSR